MSLENRLFVQEHRPEQIIGLLVLENLIKTF